MADDTDETAAKERPAHLFKPGQSGNPAGRPKGARSKLGEQFIQALQEDFETNGKTAIESVRTERPHEYLKVVASILPKQVEIKEGTFDGIGDTELAALIVAARSALNPVASSGEGAGSSGGAEPAQGVPSVH